MRRTLSLCASRVIRGFMPSAATVGEDGRGSGNFGYRFSMERRGSVMHEKEFSKGELSPLQGIEVVGNG